MSHAGSSSRLLGFLVLARWWCQRPVWLRSIALASHALLIWSVSSLQGGGFLGEPQPWKALVHNAAHVVVFSVLGALAAAVVSRRPAPAWIAAFVGCVLYGVVDEIHQSMVPDRTPSVFDVMSDACGAAIGVGLMDIAMRMRVTEFGGRFVTAGIVGGLFSVPLATWA